MALSCCKKLSRLFRGNTSKDTGDFYFLNHLPSFRTKNKFKNHTNICENHDYCHIEMPKENNKILEYNHGEKSTKAPFVIYTDLEYLFKT